MGLWGIQPSEFWRMTSAEWWLLYDIKVGEPRVGPFTESEADELYNLLP